MTTAEAPADRVAPHENALAAKKELPLVSYWTKIEALLDRLGDRLNPILVKEARQAMKSRQFVVTFSLLLICGWLWTVLFIVSGLPAIYYAPVGPGCSWATTPCCRCHCSSSSPTPLSVRSPA